MRSKDQFQVQKDFPKVFNWIFGEQAPKSIDDEDTRFSYLTLENIIHQLKII